MTSAMSRIGENLQKALGGSMNFNADDLQMHSSSI